MAASAVQTHIVERAPAKRTTTACPCCGQDDTDLIYRVPSVPVHSCVLLESAAAARAFPCRDLELAFCQACGFVFNRIFDEDAMEYSAKCEESQHFSHVFSSFARDLARQIDQKCALAGKKVLEIGCGKGEFLIELCSISNCEGIGLDPGYRPDEGRVRNGNVDFIIDCYSPKYKDISADVVLCRHTLEHIAEPRKFIDLIRDSMRARCDRWIVFETPDVQRVLREAAFWDIYYEHCSYFSAGTHAKLFRRAGFDVTDLAVVYDGQYIIQYARPAAAQTEPQLAAEYDLIALRALAATFPARVSDAQVMWRSLIRTATNEDRRIVLWGGGSKGVAFLTTLGLKDEIAAVVDVNPYKQGSFMPGSGHEVVAPSALTRIRPDLVIAMNPIYIGEISAELERLGVETEVMSL